MACGTSPALAAERIRTISQSAQPKTKRNKAGARNQETISPSIPMAKWNQAKEGAKVGSRSRT